MKTLKLVTLSFVISCVLSPALVLAADPTKLPPPLIIAAGPTKLPPPFIIAAGPTKLPPPVTTQVTLLT